jgi:hypothetical protein
MRRLDCTAAVIVGLVLIGLMGLAMPAANAVTTLTNFNSVVQVQDIGANAGINLAPAPAWTVDGVSQVALAEFRYSLDGGATFKNFDGANASLTFIGKSSSSNNPANPSDFSPTTLTTIYNESAGVQFKMQYLLTGGSAGSGTSNLRAQLTASLTNGATSANVIVYEYVDPNLAGTALGDTVTPSASDPGGTVGQTEDGTIYGETARVQQPGPNQTLLNGEPNHRQAGAQATLLTDFNGGIIPNDTPAGGVSTGPGDEAYAYSYNLALVANQPWQSLTITLDRTIRQQAATAVPEPATTMLSLLGMASLGGCLLGRRSRKAA